MDRTEISKINAVLVQLIQSLASVNGQSPEMRTPDAKKLRIKMEELIRFFPKNPEARPVEALIESTSTLHPVHVRMVARLIDGWRLFMADQVVPEEILFPDFNFDLVNDFYSTSPIYGYYHQLIILALRKVALDTGGSKPLRMIELGSGTGSTTRRVMDPDSEISVSEFWSTDVSPTLVKALKNQFTDPRVVCQVVNLDKPWALDQQFDVAFAVNVVHATKDLDHTLAQISKMLKPGGALVLGEIAPAPDHGNLLMELSFGSLPSFFNRSDRYRTDSPLLPLAQWASLLRDQGWKQVEVYPESELTNPFWGGTVTARK